MAEIKTVGLVDEDDIGTEKRVTLRPEFNWFLSDEFAELNEGFKPVDYSDYLKEKDKNMGQRKEKLPPHTTNCSFENDGVCKENSQLTNSLTSKLDDFWRIYDQLEVDNPTDIDKNTVGRRTRVDDDRRFSIPMVVLYHRTFS